MPNREIVSFRSCTRACVIIPSPGKSGPPRPATAAAATAPRFGLAALLFCDYLLFFSFLCFSSLLVLLPFKSPPTSYHALCGGMDSIKIWFHSIKNVVL